MTEAPTWCDACSGYHDAVSEGGRTVCANCGAERISPENDATVGATAPWHFWLVVGLLAVYLGWWLVRGVIWIFG